MEDIEYIISYFNASLESPMKIPMINKRYLIKKK